MLNLEEIALRIESPETCSPRDIGDLKALTIGYPYVQVFPLLYLKALANANDIRFEEELVKYAFRISDRNQLYALVNHSRTKAFSKEAGPSAIESVSDEEEAFESKTEITQDQTSDGSQLLEQEETVKQEENTPIIQKISLAEDFDAESELEGYSIPLNIKENASEIDPELVNSITDNTSPTEKDESFEQFEKEMIATVIGSTYQLEDLSQEELDTIKQTSETIENGNIDIDVLEERSFTSWLLLNKTETHKELEEEKIRMEDLVNRFVENPISIRNSPNQETERTDKPKKEFFSATKKAKESLQTERIPVSETLAHIFALQGNYPKAIFTYEQLILINPEKKSFFASQIKELKKKLNT